MSRLTVALLIAALISTPLIAQRGGNTNIEAGPIPITVLLMLPDGHICNLQHLRVELINNNGVLNHWAMSDGSGRINLSSDGPGSFQVRVTGVEVEDSTSENFIVSSRQNSAAVSVIVRLKPDMQQKNANASGSISANDLNVPDNAKKSYFKGKEALERKEWQKSIEHFQKAIAQYDKFDSAYNLLGFAYMNSGELPKGRQAFAKALSINPANSFAQKNLARILINEKDFKAARDLLVKSVAADPSSADGYTLLAWSELNLGSYPEAAMHARKVHTLEHRNYPIAHMIAGEALEDQNKKEEAATEYRLFLQEAPTAPEATEAKTALARVGGATTAEKK